MNNQGNEAMSHLEELKRLILSHKVGHALPREFYTSRFVYESDMSAYWNRNWIWVGHESQIAAPGDYMVFDYGTESIIICRDGNGAINAHHNVCRHRGSRICIDRSGNARSFACPYHAWTYDLSGKLRGGRAMAPDFNPDEWGLLKAKLIVFQGLIFVCASEDSPPIEAGLEKLAPLTAPFGFEDLKIAHSASYEVSANWKLALENYMECYHCAPSHKDYSRSHSLKAPEEMAQMIEPMRERSAAAGLPVDVLNLTGTEAHAPCADIFYRRYPLYENYKTGSKTGRQVAPLLGSLTGHDGGATDVQIGPLNNFLAYSDHVVGYRFIPRDMQLTDIQVVWMVGKDAEEGIDYNLEDLIWLWHATTLDDERIIRHNQEGVNSHFFSPGPLAEMEHGIRDFYGAYLAKLWTSANKPADGASAIK